ncbi:steroid 17-alpha-hydroxylase/17,20 lyase-like [Xenia sp. Carnegie-2017]|uniref:steroid 17-alpha-hydroxylase/17,20 lyase-like n=1 Tax=Xenia sp. Carnegie-2017 TaxID=2897299 RepID=UPI001F046C1D|nr:steroid 17-alpha-hydroxylase/17,20 lyase-like [Xenia sp. Carnegie-2017]
MITEAIVTLLLFWITWHFLKTYLERRTMPPGPWPYPLIGNLANLDLQSGKPFNKLREKYGDIVSATFTIRSVIVSNSSLAREARLGLNINITVDILEEIIFPMDCFVSGDDIISGRYGEKYIFRKRVFKSAMHMFGAGIDAAEKRGNHAVRSTMEKIYSLKDQTFSPKDIISSAIIVQLWQWLTSEELPLDHNVIKLLLEFTELAANVDYFASMFYKKIPFFKLLPVEFSRRIKRSQAIKSSVITPVFNSHLKTFHAGVVRDMTDSLIQAYKKEESKTFKKDIGCMQDIKELMIDAIVAGSDTTSSTLSWLILYMVLYPEVQDKIHDELDQVLGKDKQPSWQDVTLFPYLQATICEVLRRATPVPIIGRNTTKDTVIGGYHIPKGTLVLLDFFQIHTNEREWPEPNRFKPERFLSDDGKFVGWTKHSAFMPFGLGRRECAGIAFAKIMLFTFAATLLHRLKFELPEGAEKPSEEPQTSAIVASPANFKVVAKQRLIK